MLQVSEPGKVTATRQSHPGPQLTHQVTADSFLELFCTLLRVQSDLGLQLLQAQEWSAEQESASTGLKRRVAQLSPPQDQRGAFQGTSLS